MEIIHNITLLKTLTSQEVRDPDDESLPAE